MKCRSIQKKLIFYHENELSKEIFADMENHLENCTNCSAFLAFLQSELSVISEEKNNKTTPFFFTRLIARVEKEQYSRSQRSWDWLLQPALFTVLLIGIYGGVQIGKDASLTKIDQNAQSAMQIFDDLETEPIESFILDIL